MAPEEPYSYHTPKTGTSQDLLTVVTKAYERFLATTTTVLPAKTARQRMLLEAPFIVLGKGVAVFVRLLPAEWAISLHDALFSSLSAPRHYPFEAGNPALARARALAERLEKESGLKPAVIALISHPPVLGEMAHMNVE